MTHTNIPNPILQHKEFITFMRSLGAPPVQQCIPDAPLHPEADVDNTFTIELKHLLETLFDPPD